MNGTSSRSFGIGALTPALASAQTPGRGTITFTKHVAPIFQKACQTCHRPDSIAPMSLLTYAEARPWARSIRQKVASREMPPWNIERNIGVQKFIDDPSLSEDEIATIVQWVDGGSA